MLAHAWDFLRGGRWFRWLTGPIFEKELRCASRRRRNYVLRTAYVLLLAAMLGLMLASMPSRYGSSLYNQPWQTARLEELGRMLVFAIAWFQFIALQLAALVLMSTAVSEEIYRRTLGTLVTTPLTSLQIVMGKLAGRMLQLLLLLALSVPPLLLLRVFGGIPWEYVLGAVAVTFTALLFVAALTMFFSIFNRHAYVVILATLIALAAVFLLAPWLTGTVMDAMGAGNRRIMASLASFNPYMMLFLLTEQLMGPGFIGLPRMFGTDLARHCGLMLAASTVIIAACTAFVRRAARCQATGAPFRLLRRRGAKDAAAAAGDSPAHVPVGRVTGPPVLWREIRQPLIRGRIKRRLLPVLALLVLFGTYVSTYFDNAIADRDTHTAYLVTFLLLAMLITAITGATPITTEKEAQTLPLLLATPQTGGRIIAGKFLGALRRCLPVWLLMAVHFAVFAPFGLIAWFVPALMAFVAAGMMCFQTGTGLFFGALVKRTTTAVVLNVLLGLALWALVPFILVLIEEASGPSRNEISGGFLYLHPGVQTVVIAAAGCGEPRHRTGYYGDNSRNLAFNWPNGNSGAGASATFIIFSSALYGLAGLGAAALAAGLLRPRAP